MRYVIEFTEEVLEDQLPKIPKTMRKRILDAIEESLSSAPHDYGKRFAIALRTIVASE